jgi:membrane-associated phospholipid phosphatase
MRTYNKRRYGQLGWRSFLPGCPLFAKRTLVNLGRWLAVLGHSGRARAAYWPPSISLGIALAIPVIVGSMFFVDAAASKWALRLPPDVIDTARQISKFGLSGWLLYPLGFILLCLAAVMTPSLPRLTQGTLAALAARFGFLFLAIGLPGLFAAIIKRIVGRARPYVGIQDDPFAYMPFIWRPEYASMPSGHATTATAAAIAIGTIWPRSRLVAWLYAVVILFTRVAINVHHPSDVVAGAVVGMIGAFSVRHFFAARHLVFSADDLAAHPWPSFKRIKAAARQVVIRA